jgi:hypothetical protein
MVISSPSGNLLEDQDVSVADIYCVRCFGCLGGEPTYAGPLVTKRMGELISEVEVFCSDARYLFPCGSEQLVQRGCGGPLDGGIALWMPGGCPKADDRISDVLLAR